MNPAKRVFVLLGAYEDLTDRETSALRRGEIEHAQEIERRKLHLAEAMNEARKIATMTPEEVASMTQRVRSLDLRETANLEFLRGETDRVRGELAELNKSAQRLREVRRGYVTSAQGNSGLTAGELGRA